MRSERINLRNCFQGAIIFHLEPWAEEHFMPAGGEFKISAVCPDEGHVLEIEVAVVLPGSGLLAPNAPLWPSSEKRSSSMRTK